MYQLVREAVEIISHMNKNRGRIFAIHTVSDFFLSFGSTEGTLAWKLRCYLNTVESQLNVS
jgi:hypothetical protein